MHNNILTWLLVRIRSTNTPVKTQGSPRGGMSFESCKTTAFPVVAYLATEQTLRVRRKTLATFLFWLLPSKHGGL